MPHDLLPTAPRLNILLKAARGHHVVDVRTILFIEADDRYCRVTFTDGSHKHVFHTLTEVEKLLCCGSRHGDLLFVRPHRGHIVAWHHAAATEGRTIVLSGDVRLPVSKSHWPRLLNICSKIDLFQNSPIPHLGGGKKGEVEQARPNTERGLLRSDDQP